MIKVKNLTFRYRGKAPLLRDMSLHFEVGQIYGLLGANGTGKSTLLKLIGGLLTPEGGVVEVCGVVPSRRWLATIQQIAFVPEEFSFPNIPIGDYVRTTTPFYPAFDGDFFVRAMEAFGVDSRAKFGALSMGERKKVYIAFAMACGTSLLVLDEPTNGLDIPSKATFRRLLAEWMTPERTAIISTHQVKDVENLLDHIVIIDRRGVVVDASVEEVTSKLQFTLTPDATGALYSEPTLGGYAAIVENTSEAESRLNIELLFGAATTAREEIKRILNSPTK